MKITPLYFLAWLRMIIKEDCGRMILTTCKSYTLRLFLPCWNPSFSKVSIVGQRYKYMWLLFLELNKHSLKKMLNAENTIPVNTTTEAMQVKSWNDVTGPMVPVARS